MTETPPAALLLRLPLSLRAQIAAAARADGVSASKWALLVLARQFPDEEAAVRTARALARKRRREGLRGPMVE